MCYEAFFWFLTLTELVSKRTCVIFLRVISAMFVCVSLQIASSSRPVSMLDYCAELLCLTSVAQQVEFGSNLPSRYFCLAVIF